MSSKRKLWSIVLLIALVLTTVACPIQASAAENGIAIDEAHFPDAEFRAYVAEHCDSNHDGSLSALEADNVTQIIIDSESEEDVIEYSTVGSLKGIEYFFNLQVLSCYSQSLSELDLSHNPNLKILDCHYTGLKSLDVTHNYKLESLNCRSIAELTNLDVSNNPGLKMVDCSYCVELTSLNTTQNPKLQILKCGGTNITNLDVGHNLELVELDFSSLRISNLDISKNTKVEVVICNDADIISLDTSKNSELRELYCSGTRLTNLDVSKNPKLEVLFCIGRETDDEVVRISSLDLSKNPALKNLNCGYTDITNLDLSKNLLLETLWCWGAELTSLDVSKNLKLKDLNCMDTNITSLDLQKNAELRDLYTSSCPLISLLVPSGFTGSVSKPSTYKLSLLPGQDSVDLKTIAPTIQGEKILNLQGCEKQGTVLTGLKVGQRITYDYDYNGGFITVTIEVIEGSGTGAEQPEKPVQQPTISAGEGYSTSLSEDGTTVTIAVKDGYVLEDVKVNGISKGKLSLIPDLKTGDRVEITVSKIEEPTYDFEEAIITISSKSYAYTGKIIKPTPTVVFDGNMLEQDVDYTVSYSKNKKIGTASVIVEGKGVYQGKQIIDFKIVPKKVTISSAKSLEKKSVTVRWKKVPQATGYQVQWRKSSKFSSSLSKKVKGTSITSTKIKKLSSKKKYYVRVRAYKVVNGKTYYGKWSTVRTAKVK